MTLEPIELLTLVFLSQKKELRDSIEPDRFTGQFVEVFRRFRADPVGVLHGVLLEMGVEWDGKAKLTDTVIDEYLRQSQVRKARLMIQDKRDALHLAELALRYPNVAGRDGVDAAVKVVEELKTEEAA